MKQLDKNESAFADLVIHYMLSFKQICLVTAFCPLAAIVICFITAYIFQADDVHETHCRVYNIIPSISAITGVSPQRYLWRISVALHIGPRFIVAAVHRAYLRNLISRQSDLKQQNAANRWINYAYWLNITEIASLCGVTYISNLENYPVHEKIFIVFMISSLSHMLACIKAMRFVAETHRYFGDFESTIKIKTALFIVAVLSTIGIVVFFLEHRLYCHDMAFSRFALCEYILASVIMSFHIAVMMDFPTEYLLIAKGINDLKLKVQ